MIHTTLGALAAAEDSMKAVADLKLPIKTSYALSKLVTAVSTELEHFHKQRIAWVEELGSKNAEGLIEVGPSGIPEFLTRMNELAAIAVELQGAPITFDMLGETDLSAHDITTLIAAGLLIEPVMAPVADGPHLVDTKKEQPDGKRQLQPAKPRR
jgi:hypothetical protein